MAFYLEFFFQNMKADLREKFRFRSQILWEIFGILVTLAVYFYTAKAFSPAFTGRLHPGTTYFEFVLMGELVLILPSVMLDGQIKSLKRFQKEGLLEIFAVGRVRLAPLMLIASLAFSIKDLLRVLLVLLAAYLIFPFHVDVSSLPLLVLLQILFLPVFCALGALAASVLIYTRRGEHLLSNLHMVIAMAAGAYFPVSVLPEIVQKLSRFLSPFTVLLDQSRDLMGGGSLSAEWLWAPAGFAVGLLFLFLSKMLLERAIFRFLGDGDINKSNL